MADVFGDLSLFSEFDREREAEGSFIRYDEESKRSRIIFEGFGSDDDSEADLEKEGRESESLEETESGEESISKQKDENRSDADVKKDKKLNGKPKPDSNLSDSDKELAWLNEQLYADAEEDVKDSHVNVNQLMFEKNKYERFCKIMDTTRFVPDDDSPPVQILFHNSAFARKYRQQIEQFIKGLLWADLHSDKSHGPSEGVTVKPGTPSSVDINSKLPLEQRCETMRQMHALIGSCQFHNKFLVDFLGWPFSVGEPTRCNENWEIPLYGQVFNEVYADPSSKGKSQQKKKVKPACWNCGTENHSVAECRHPRNPARIAANRKEFLEKHQQDNEPKFTGAKRYHLDPEIASKFAKFHPGHISDNLREALGLRTDQLPQHIYKMRLFGYPPGWLAQAKPVQSSVTIFDKNGRVTLITGECLEDGELDEGDKEANSDYDINKIVEFPGFTMPVPLGFVDEHVNFQMPPIQQHQLKKALMKQSNEKSSKKRKRKAGSDEKEAVKRAKMSADDGEEGEIQDNDNAVEEEDTQPTEMENDSENASVMDKTPTATAPAAMNRSSSTISLSRDFGTPILVREKSSLPDASKFGVGIEDHIPFENLPDAVGMFEKMKDLIDVIRKKKAERL